MTTVSKAQLHRLKKNWGAQVSSTASIDKVSTAQSITRIYQLANLQDPVVFFCQSPWQSLLMPLLLQIVLRSPNMRRSQQELAELLSDESPMWQALWQNVCDHLNEKSVRRSGNSSVHEYLLRALGADRSDSMLSLDLWHKSLRVAERFSRLVQSLESQRNLQRTEELPAGELLLEMGSGSPFTPRGQISAHIRRSNDFRAAPAVLVDLVPEQDRRTLSAELWKSSEFKEPPEVEQALQVRFQNDLNFQHLWWGSWEIVLPLYEYLIENPSLFSNESELCQWLNLARQGCCYAFFETVCFVCERPLSIAQDDQGRLHNEKDAAIVFSDGYQIHSWHGVTVPSTVITNPESITVDSIDEQPNLEIRRVMLERFGEENYLAQAGAAPVHEDEFGILYRREMSGDEPLVMVKVINSTPEPDGHHKEYYLRVPPNIRTARAAVAWTFGMQEKAYNPVVET